MLIHCCLSPPWPLQAARRLQILEEMKQIASSDNNFKNYRDRLRTINPPCVPFVGEKNRPSAVMILIIRNIHQTKVCRWLS